MASDGEERVVEEYRLLMADVYELAGLSRRVSEREAATEGSTVARWHLLSVVSAESLSVPDIARRLGQVRQGVQRVVDELVDEGQLVREPNPAHVRSPLVAITDAGRVMLDRLWGASADSRRQLLHTAGLDDVSLAETRETIQRLATSLRELSAARGGDGERP